MTMYFVNGETLLKQIINRKGEFDTIIHLETKKEMNKSEFLKMNLLEIKNMGQFAVC